MLKKLHTVNLSHNKIRVVEGLEGMNEIKSLDLSHNLIAKISDCEQLKELPALTNLDLRNNQISDHNNLLPFFNEMQELLCLYVKGNPGIRMVTNFRREMTFNMKKLYYLDDRPITEIERAGIEAFKEGGKEAEAKVRDEISKAALKKHLPSVKKLTEQMNEAKV